MNEELISQIYSVKSSTVDHMKGLLEDVKNHKTQHLESKIKKLEKELKNIKKTKRYGLVWEDKPEDVVERCKSELPFLKEVTSRRISKTDEDLHHIIMEGDNFHALSTLAYTHAGKVDVIYIDPPYNTGNQDFMYNDKFLDKEDTFRHSKWLSFMNKRLKLARKLLKSDGVIFISIDDNEQAQLKLLCDEIFGEKNFVSSLKWKRKKQPSFLHNQVAGIMEYILVYATNISQLSKLSLENTLGDTKPLFNASNNESERIFKEGIEAKFEEGIIKKGKYKPRTMEIEFLDDVIVKNFKIQNTFRLKAKFRDSQKKIDIYQNEGVIFISKNYTFRRHPIKEEEGNSKPILDLLLDWGQNQDADTEMRKIFDGDSIFSNPKPSILIKNIIKSTQKDNPVVLDFFAGSGTTGHAVLELNREDGGKRQCILCTNNENQIAEEVTYPRMRNVIEGYADVEGIPANMRYYKTEFIQVEKSLDDLRYQFIGLCDDLLCIKENTFEEVKLNGQSDELKLYKNSKKNMVILYDIHHFDACTKLLRTLENPTKVYIFSLAKEIYEEALSGIGKDIEIANIPDDILQTYKKIFHF